MCYETDNAVKSKTVDESKVSYTIVQDDDDIYSVKRGTWWAEQCWRIQKSLIR